MGAFEDLLKRQGYVKLDQYGLVLTPDDRILSTRPAVLDDGLGGKIVGWSDGDLAAAELEHWGAAAKPAAAKRVAANPGLQSVPPAPPRLARGTAPPIPTRVTGPAPIVPAFIAPAPVTKPAVVAAEPVVEEDEWEWEIAMARARAVAVDVQMAAASMVTSFTAPSARKAPPKKTLMMPASDPMTSWGSTETLHETWADATRESSEVMSPAAKTLAVVKTAVRVNTPPAGRSTVIPIPTLPVAAKGTDVRGFNPGAPPPRFASQQRRTQPKPIRMAARSEDTVVTGAVQAATEDHTSPYVTLPSEVKPTGYAHTKRVAAKHR